MPIDPRLTLAQAILPQPAWAPAVPGIEPVQPSLPPLPWPEVPGLPGDAIPVSPAGQPAPSPPALPAASMERGGAQNGQDRFFGGGGQGAIRALAEALAGENRAAPAGPSRPVSDQGFTIGVQPQVNELRHIGDRIMAGPSITGQLAVAAKEMASPRRMMGTLGQYMPGVPQTALAMAAAGARPSLAAFGPGASLIPGGTATSTVARSAMPVSAFDRTAPVAGVNMAGQGSAQGRGGFDRSGGTGTGGPGNRTSANPGSGYGRGDRTAIGPGGRLGHV